MRRRRMPYWAGLATAGLVLALAIGRLAMSPKANARPTPALCVHDAKSYSHGAVRPDGRRWLQCASGVWVPVTLN